MIHTPHTSTMWSKGADHVLFPRRHHTGASPSRATDASVVDLAGERLRRRRASGTELTGYDFLPLLLAHGVDDRVLADHLARTANAIQRHMAAVGAPRPAESGDRLGG
ncbi:hypothetical protein [Streptomyces sp. NPDC018031]|uniref:hypothetical protein n=1 Tax=Streptomyces sp. NPDC018031 TaxID=3365033 RepID=UPI0037A723CD